MLRRRVMRVGLSIMGAIVTAIIAAILWPGPHAVPTVDCGPDPGYSCAQASGRVVFSESFAPGKRVHLILLSRRSLTLPGVVVVKMPPVQEPPGGLALGRWLSVAGYEVKGSHGEQNIHVMAFATTRATVRCRWGRRGQIICFSSSMSLK